MAGKQTKGGNQGTRTVLKPVVHQDTWFLRILPPPADTPGVSPAVRWERRKRPANPPNPARAGATMASHKGRGILFGGVHDVEESEEGIESEFFNTLYAWNVERNRYFQLILRRPKVAGKKHLAPERSGGRRGKGKANEEELLRNLAALEAKGSSFDAQAVDITTAAEEEEDLPSRPTKELSMELPHPRFNAQLAVQDDVLYILGGTYEKGDREYTFDEMWAIDLGRLDGVKEIYKRDLENWEGSDAEDSEEDDEDEMEEDDDDMEDKDTRMGGTSPDYQVDSEAGVAEVSDLGPTSKTSPLASALQEIELDVESALSDSNPHPRPFENLREFFTRTSNEWQDIILEDHKKSDLAANRSIKELRKQAFDRAEEKWWDCREEIRALEDEQEEAGIGEVVSLADRNNEGGGAGRRR